MRNTECPHCSVANYCRQQPWCPRHLKEVQHNDAELSEARLENCAKDLRECQELMQHWWSLSARLYHALEELLDAAYDTEASGVPCVTLEPAMEEAQSIIDEAEKSLTSSSS